MQLNLTALKICLERTFYVSLEKKGPNSGALEPEPTNYFSFFCPRLFMYTLYHFYTFFHHSLSEKDNFTIHYKSFKTIYDIRK